MPRIKIIIEYDGSKFHGWQDQNNLNIPTVHSRLRHAISLSLKEEIPYLEASGRTDAGVHAKALVVVFNTIITPDLGLLIRSVSNILKSELSIKEACFVNENFNPRRDAKYKQYSYRILNRDCPPTYQRGTVWFVTKKLDFEILQTEAQKIIGKHDFQSFRASSCSQRNTVKTIYESKFEIKEELLVYTIIGSGFLQHMVRIIVGTLIDIAKGVLPQDTNGISQILLAYDRSKAGITAPPYGLFLDYVSFENWSMN